jgi:hypothetical protein
VVCVINRKAWQLDQNLAQPLTSASVLRRCFHMQVFQKRSKGKACYRYESGRMPDRMRSHLAKDDERQ